MVINKKNDGTVKMTRRRATSKPHLLGMTQDRKVLDRYRQTASEKRPKQLADERRAQELSQSQGPTPYRTIIEEWPYQTMYDFKWGSLKLFFYMNQGFYFLEEKNGVRRISIRYPSRERAMQAVDADYIRWFHTFD